MKKKTVINLIQYYVEKNDFAFREEAYEVAKYFDSIGDTELSQYIMGLLSGAAGYSPQEVYSLSEFFTKVSLNNDPLPLPKPIFDDILGIANAIGKNAINKFLFQGAPGTGKTETAKQLAKMLDRELFVVDFSTVIDSRLGQTQKNIVQLFGEINAYEGKSKVIFLFDEIDALAMDRTNPNDIREMGRATSTFLKCMDELIPNAVLVATTNLFKHFDQATKRRFDAIVDFNRYTYGDLVEVALSALDLYIKKFQPKGRNKTLFLKLLKLCPKLPMPGELKNIIKTAIIFSNNQVDLDYLKRLYRFLVPDELEIEDLKKEGLTTREIEILTGISKSQVSRKLKR